MRGPGISPFEIRSFRALFSRRSGRPRVPDVGDAVSKAFRHILIFLLSCVSFYKPPLAQTWNHCRSNRHQVTVGVVQTGKHGLALQVNA